MSEILQARGTIIKDQRRGWVVEFRCPSQDCQIPYSLEVMPYIRNCVGCGIRFDLVAASVPEDVRDRIRGILDPRDEGANDNGVPE